MSQLTRLCVDPFNVMMNAKRDWSSRWQVDHCGHGDARAMDATLTSDADEDGDKLGLPLSLRTRLQCLSAIPSLTMQCAASTSI